MHFLTSLVSAGIPVPDVSLYLDCDNDDECDGDLECFQRLGWGNETIPGCYGAGYAGRDYCFDRADRDIVDVAVSTSELSVLVDLLASTNLVDTLKGAGPFTVFAPTNEALEALDASSLDMDALTEVLLYHVVSGKKLSSDLVNVTSLTTVLGEDVAISSDPVKINNAEVVTADIEAANGVIHIIDSVLMPPAMAEETEEPVEKELSEAICSSESPCLECSGDCDSDQGKPNK